MIKQVDRLGDYATIDGAARAVGVTYWTVAGYVRHGKVPAFRFGGKTKVVRISDVLRTSSGPNRKGPRKGKGE